MGKRRMDSELHRIKLDTGTVYQTKKGGTYYFRYQINKERKCISLKTANQEEALRKAKELLPTVQATDLEVIATHVKVARKKSSASAVMTDTEDVGGIIFRGRACAVLPSCRGCRNGVCPASN